MAALLIHSLPLAHASVEHWSTYVVYAAPVLVVVGSILYTMWTQKREEALEKENGEGGRPEQ